MGIEAKGWLTRLIFITWLLISKLCRCSPEGSSAASCSRIETWALPQAPPSAVLSHLCPHEVQTSLLPSCSEWRPCTCSHCRESSFFFFFFGACTLMNTCAHTKNMHSPNTLCTHTHHMHTSEMHTHTTHTKHIHMHTPNTRMCPDGTLYRPTCTPAHTHNAHVCTHQKHSPFT